jgi:uncharacterized protein YcbX
MGGERLAEIELEGHGVVGDRRWGVRDREAGVVLTAKRCGALLHARACLLDGTTVVALPDGRSAEAGSAELDGALSDWLGRPVALEAAEPEPFLEDAWVDGSLAMGEARLDARKPCGRCVMVTRAQPGLAEDRSRLRRLRGRDGRFGVYLRVARPGVVREGDEVTLR